MKFSRLRILLLTFFCGLTLVNLNTRINNYFAASPVKVSAVHSDVPVILRICPENLPSSKTRKTFYNTGSYTGEVTDGFPEMCFSGGGGAAAAVV